MEVVISLVGKLVEYSVAPVVRQFGYLIHYESNVAHLTSQVKTLTAKRDGVILKIDAATRNLETILPDVQNWLERANQILQEEEIRFEKETRAKAECCSNGWFPNLKIRHSLSRKAKKMSPDVDSLLGDKFESVACSGPPPQLGFQPTQQSGHDGIMDFESRKSTVRDVMEALKGNQFNPIVICGMGGIGKTTLVGEVVNKAKIEGLFVEYAKAIVNEKPDPSKIQRDVAEYLGLELREEGLEARADKLRERLSGTKRVLIVLDNVWETLDLWGIGIPSGSKSCKVLVTSRNEHIFNEMEETRKKFPVGGLPESDAWSLFKKVAGGYIESDPELRSIAEQVLRECDGLPVAISTLGSALRQKEIAIWKDTLGLLQKPFGGDIPGMEKNVYQTIRLSYDYLERKEAKSCFLLCCVFPESTDIVIEDLVTHGLGLRLFQGIDSVEGGRYRVEALLGTLKSCYLLLDSDKEEHVRIHDVVRAVGLYIASDESGGTFLVRHGVALEGWPQRYTSTSLTVTTNKTSPELLLLSRTNEERSSSLEILGTLNGVEDLKVLDISVPCDDISLWESKPRQPRLTSLPVLLKNIQTLCLKGLKLELQTISVIGELRTLMILRLSESDIMHIPEEFKNLCNLKLLDLGDCWRLKEISPGIISSLSKLEELYLWGSFKNWDDDGMISVSELLDLPLLTSLQTDLPPVVDILRNNMLLFDKLKRFKLSVRKKALLWITFPENSGCNYLLLEDVDADSLVAVTVLLKKTDVLEFDMRSLAHHHNVLDAECFAKLKYLKVIDCSGLEYLVDLTRMKSSPVFPVLDTLQICNAAMLKEIFHGVLPVGSLKQLRKLYVGSETGGGAPVLRHLWKIESHFDRLESLSLRNCQSLQVIVACQENEEEANQINFPNLTSLSLEYLPSLVGISSKKVCKLNFPRLLELNLEMLPEFVGCWTGLDTTSHSNDVAVQHLLDPKVDFPVLTDICITKMWNFKEIWNNRLSPYSFCELRALNVESCDKISHLVPTYMQARLQKLVEINVRDCSSLQEVFESRRSRINEDEGSRQTPSNISQPDQGRMQISNQIMDFKVFQHLTVLRFIECDSLRYVCSSSIARSLVNLKDLFIGNCRNMEEIVATEEGEEAEDNNMFLHLTFLSLGNLPKLISFSRDKYALDWPSMEYIHIWDCPKMKNFSSGSLNTPMKMKIGIYSGVDENIQGVDENIFRELEMSKKEKLI